MKKLALFLPIILFCSFCFAFGGKTPFCKGFETGYKTVKGDISLVPLCPLEPITPIGSTPYREGIKAGMRAANR